MSRKAELTIYTADEAHPVLEAHEVYATVLVREPDESHFSEALFGLDGLFRYDFDGDAIEVAEWALLPTKQPET